MADCRLCELAQGRGRGLRLYEDATLVVVLGLRAGLPARLLVVPRAHVSTAAGLDEGLQDHLLEVGLRAAHSLGVAGLGLGGVRSELQHAGDHVFLQLAAGPSTTEAA